MTKEWQISFLKDLLKRFTRYERTVSIIIQGPLNERSISTIPEYLKRGDVIVSCWDNDNLDQLDEYKDDIKIVVNKYSDVENCHKKTGGSAAPWVLQHHTTLHGLLLAKSHFSIKVRSDESYPDLDPLIDKLIKQNEERDPQTGEFENRIITSNIYFRKDATSKFHPSDHIVSGRTSRMIDCFRRAKHKASIGTADRFAEQLFARAVIESKWNKELKMLESIDPDKSAEQMRKNFDIIRIFDLPEHIWTASYRKYREIYHEEPDWCMDMGDSFA